MQSFKKIKKKIILTHPHANHTTSHRQSDVVRKNWHRESRDGEKMEDILQRLSLNHIAPFLLE